MSNIYYLYGKNYEPPSTGRPPAGGEPPVNDLEKRVSDLEVIAGRIDERTQSIKEHGATKADISGTESRLIKWQIGIMLTVLGLMFAIIKIFG